MNNVWLELQAKMSELERECSAHTVLKKMRKARSSDEVAREMRCSGAKRLVCTESDVALLENGLGGSESHMCRCWVAKA